MNVLNLQRVPASDRWANRIVGCRWPAWPGASNVTLHRRGAWLSKSLLAASLVLLAGRDIASAAGSVSISAPEQPVRCFDFIEVTVKVGEPAAGNPFTEGRLTGTFGLEGQTVARVEGFCDAPDGSVFRIRFMPRTPGRHTFHVSFRFGDLSAEQTGNFTAQKSTMAGPVRIDPQHPFHFVREGSGEHWFWNGTTTYQVLAWDDETIAAAVDRLARLGVNRIRVALAGRTKDGGRWNEPLVHRTARFKFKMEPWVAARPDNLENPGYDVHRFNLEHFRKAERLLRLARERNLVVSLIFYVDGRDAGVDPFGKERSGGSDEQLYYRYTISRLAPFANIMWDVANEYRLFRDDAWAEKMGALVKQFDPYQHLTSTHGHEDFHFRKSTWADFAMFQSWDESGGYRFMLRNRAEQIAAGRPMPQINEEYGYEDHYPTGWGGARTWPARNADNRRRLAWAISMAGGYQTTGERANQGTGAGPDTGGGWVNGRGDEHMTMLLGYRHLMDFFRSMPWWTLEPHEDLAATNTLLLAQPAQRYVAYLPLSGRAKFQLAPGAYRAQWYNPRTGTWLPQADVVQPSAGEWTSPPAPDVGDWALLVESAAAGGAAGANQLGVFLVLDPDPDKTVRLVRSLGLSACELYTEKFTQSLGFALREATERHAVAVSALFTMGPGPLSWDFYGGPNQNGLVPRAYRAERVARLKEASDFAKTCGIGAIETEVGFIPEDPNDPLYQETIEALREVVGYCRRQGQTFLYHAGSESPVTLLRTIQDVGLDNQGVGLDTANSILYGRGHPVDALAIYGRYLRAVNAKDGLWPTDVRHLGKEVPIGQGQVDFPRLVARLRELQYAGPITIERETSGPEKIEDIKKAKLYLEHLLRNALD